MRALNEIGAMAQKAALGAGVPLGQAEDLGRTAIHLAGTGGDLQMIVDALAEPMSQLELKWGSDHITILAGPVALAGPVIRDAFAMGASKAVLADATHVSLVVTILAQDGVEMVTSGTTLTRKGERKEETLRGPFDVPAAVWTALEALAAKTYVPESDASRISGAGAGLTDND